MTRILLALLTAGFALYAMPAFATHAHPWQYNFQEAASPSAERIQEFHMVLLWIITIITIFVLCLLLYVAIRYNRRANPTPSQVSHNVLIEIIWTVIPVLILLGIAVPSFRLLYYTDRTTEAEMTLKVTGYQWYWGYEYPDQGGINFLSYMIPEKDIDASKGQLRLLSTDAHLVLPVDTNIRILVTAADVIHAFALPALGVKIDAMPGHTNETWVRITKPGTYYGQCSELCGKDHAYMPIEVRAVSKEEFNAWVETMKQGDS
jgi:cytochrome c oxidase subunit 2